MIPATARRCLTFALLVLTTACSGDGPQEPPAVPPPEPPVQPPVQPPKEPPPPPLLPGVYEILGLQSSLPVNDLEPLRTIVGTAQVVALGESTHTSAGYYAAKARLIRYMVEHMGFRVVGFESPWLEARPAAQYVADCSGTASAALGSLNGVWHDANVRDLLSFLCDWNRRHPADRVTFSGFDIQEPWRTAPALRQFVMRAAPAEVERTAGIFACLGASNRDMREFYTSGSFRDHVAGRRDAAANEGCMTAIAELEAWIDARAPVLTAATSAVEVEEARIAAISLRAWQKQLWVPDPGGYEARDHGMAELVRRLRQLHTPGQKTVLWAWNWHIARRYEEVRGFDDDPGANVPRQGARAMGGFLHDVYGADYLPIALIGYDVAINSGGVTPPLQTHPLSVERRLHDLGRNYLLVDLRQPLADSLIPAGTTLRISQEWGDPYRQFGALLFLDRSPPMAYVDVSR